jgi:hypothetical protein
MELKMAKIETTTTVTITAEEMRGFIDFIFDEDFDRTLRNLGTYLSHDFSGKNLKYLTFAKNDDSLTLEFED